MKLHTFFFTLLILLVIALGLAFLFGWLSPDGENQVRYKDTPNKTKVEPAEKPVTDSLANNDEDNDGDQKVSFDDRLTVSSVTEGDTLHGQTVIHGKARGSMFSEGSFPVSVVDANGKTIAETMAKAEGPWMTSEYVPFRAVLQVVPNDGTAKSGELVFQNDNPSGKEENQRVYTVPVRLTIPNETMKVSAFFIPPGDSQNPSCDNVDSVRRNIPASKATGNWALYALLSGPTESEQENGFHTAIAPNVELMGLNIEGSVAHADFSSELKTAGSCMVEAVRAQITETLQQFDSVDEVEIAIEGNTETVLQP